MKYLSSFSEALASVSVGDYVLVALSAEQFGGCAFNNATSVQLTSKDLDELGKLFGFKLSDAWLGEVHCKAARSFHMSAPDTGDVCSCLQVGSGHSTYVIDKNYFSKGILFTKDEVTRLLSRAGMTIGRTSEGHELVAEVTFLLSDFDPDMSSHTSVRPNLFRLTRCPDDNGSHGFSCSCSRCKFVRKNNYTPVLKLMQDGKMAEAYAMCRAQLNDGDTDKEFLPYMKTVPKTKLDLMLDAIALGYFDNLLAMTQGRTPRMEAHLSFTNLGTEAHDVLPTLTESTSPVGGMTLPRFNVMDIPSLIYTYSNLPMEEYYRELHNRISVPIRILNSL